MRRPWTCSLIFGLLILLAAGCSEPASDAQSQTSLPDPPKAAGPSKNLKNVNRTNAEP